MIVRGNKLCNTSDNHAEITSWNVGIYNLAYFGLAIILYTYACLSLNRARWSGGNPPSLARQWLGCHLAFIFLLVGFAFHFKDDRTIIGFFIASIAAGLAIPYILLRHS